MVTFASWIIAFVVARVFTKLSEMESFGFAGLIMLIVTGIQWLLVILM